jgi:cell division inhibitor SepF
MGVDMSAMRRIGEYLGLVEDTGRYDDEYDYDDEGYQEHGARDGGTRVQEAPVPARRASKSGAVADLAAHRRPTAVPSPVELSRIVTLHPSTYNEARIVGEHYREHTPVIMNLTEMDDSDAKRLVDFAAGLVFATHGSIERVTNKVFLLSPANISVTAEDKRRMVESGFFNQS